MAEFKVPVKQLSRSDSPESVAENDSPEQQRAMKMCLRRRQSPSLPTCAEADDGWKTISIHQVKDINKKGIYIIQAHQQGEDIVYRMLMGAKADMREANITSMAVYRSDPGTIVTTSEGVLHLPAVGEAATWTPTGGEPEELERTPGDDEISFGKTQATTAPAGPK
jgi:hypothetical protein